MTIAANGSTSKKRSAANSRLKPPKRVVFFLDRSLGKKVIAGALRQAGVQTEVHDDHFPPDARDETWLKAVGARGWVVLTKDRRLRYRTPELAALMASGVPAFVLTAGNVRGDEMAAIFAGALPKILKFMRKHKPPFVAALTRRGQIQIVADRHLRR
jgi:predicted nuclease of predicted toxin-antitoxin system